MHMLMAEIITNYLVHFHDRDAHKCPLSLGSFYVQKRKLRKKWPVVLVFVFIPRVSMKCALQLFKCVCLSVQCVASRNSSCIQPPLLVTLVPVGQAQQSVNGVATKVCNNKKALLLHNERNEPWLNNSGQRNPTFYQD